KIVGDGIPAVVYGHGQLITRREERQPLDMVADDARPFDTAHLHARETGIWPVDLDAVLPEDGQAKLRVLDWFVRHVFHLDRHRLVGPEAGGGSALPVAEAHARNLHLPRAHAPEGGALGAAFGALGPPVVLARVLGQHFVGQPGFAQL